ncbi:MAG: aminotransferase class V-fold PLP-dependent enzyme [Parvularculaceae bacterium]
MEGILRDRFPILGRKTYLNSCSYGALSFEVRGAYEAYLDAREEFGSPWDQFVAKNEEVRGLFAELIHAAPEEIAVTASASASLNALVSGLDFSGPRRKIVVSDFEFPTVGQIWNAQKARGAEIAYADQVDGAEGARVPLERFEKLIDDQTLLVSIAHVCYRNGARNDIEGVVRLARERGALVLVDAYQALGAIPIDVKTLDVDMLIGGPLKYLLGSAGAGFLYMRDSLLTGISPFVTGWFAQADIFAMDHRRHAPAPTAQRFEAGTPPVPSLYAAAAGLRLVQSVGAARIREHVLQLTDQLKCGAAEMGVALATPADPARHGSMIAFRATDEAALVDRLAQVGIVTSSRDGNLRVSPHFYNSSEDIERLLAALRENRDLLRNS